jgi:hypothetical protein
MRYRLVALLLFAVLPAMSVLAAPAPDPSAILDIGPPPKGETAEQYRKRLIGAQTCHPTLCKWWSDTEVRKLPSVARFKDARPWLAKNLRVTEEDGERRLRLTFRAGNRAEQLTIINALLRENLAVAEDAIKRDEEWIHIHEKGIRELEERIKSTRDPQQVASHQKGIHYLRTNEIPACRADIARWKQIAVIKWAK